MYTIWKRFFSGDKRTLKIKKNIFASSLFKGIDIFIYLLLVPLTLGYLNAYEYGIWLTINSFLVWINSFDIGLGNGLRNKLAIAIAKDNWKLGRIYVSTTFYTLIIIMACLFAIIYACSFFIDWYSILNVNSDTVPRLNDIILISLAFFCLNFIFKFIGNIYLALQLPAITTFLNLLGHALSLIIIWWLTKTTDGSLLYVAIAYSASPLLVYIIAYPFTFFSIYAKLSPSIKLVEFLYLKDLMKMGIQFFFLQIAGVVLFASSNIIISRILGPENVMLYNITYRYFSVILLIFSILTNPIWSAVTEAYTNGDMKWIKESIHKIQLLLLGTVIVIIGMIILGKLVFRFWIGNDISVPFTLILCMGIYIYILVWNVSYSQFLYGIGKLRILVLSNLISVVLFYPLSVFLTKLGSVTYMVFAMILINLVITVFNTIQLRKIINNSARGIWTK